MRKTAVAIIIAILLTLPAFAQQPHALSDAEQREWQQFTAAEKQRTDALTAAVNDLLNTPTGPDSITVHSHYQTAWLALRLAQTERGLWLANLRAAKGCADCVIEGKELVPPKAAR